MRKEVEIQKEKEMIKEHKKKMEIARHKMLAMDQQLEMEKEAEVTNNVWQYSANDDDDDDFDYEATKEIPDMISPTSESTDCDSFEGLCWAEMQKRKICDSSLDQDPEWSEVESERAQVPDQCASESDSGRESVGNGESSSQGGQGPGEPLDTWDQDSNIPVGADDSSDEEILDEETIEKFKK